MPGESRSERGAIRPPSAFDQFALAPTAGPVRLRVHRDATPTGTRWRRPGAPGGRRIRDRLPRAWRRPAFFQNHAGDTWSRRWMRIGHCELLNSISYLGLPLPRYRRPRAVTAALRPTTRWLEERLPTPHAVTAWPPLGLARSAGALTAWDNSGRHPSFSSRSAGCGPSRCLTRSTFPATRTYGGVGVEGRAAPGGAPACRA